jgi:hypothetical protein
MKARTKTLAVTRSTSPTGSRSRPLTPARIRGLHAKLDELIQSNDSVGLKAVVSLIDTLNRHHKDQSGAA